MTLKMIWYGITPITVQPEGYCSFSCRRTELHFPVTLILTKATVPDKDKLRSFSVGLPAFHSVLLLSQSSIPL